MAKKDAKLIKSELVLMRCTEEEKQQIVEYAASQHIDTSKLIRLLLTQSGVFDYVVNK